jgi:hypothetical protein
MGVRARKNQAVGRFIEQLSLVYMMAARIVHDEPDALIRAILAIGHIVMHKAAVAPHVRMRLAVGSGVAV